jgi:type II secretory ATPase GspE/PulE/Tfp pilus assembly ATPase PilB-like protein
MAKDKTDKLIAEIKKGEIVSIIDLVDSLLEKAIEDRVSDIHIDPGENTLRIRFRVDGVLKEAYCLPKTTHGEIISRIKVISKLRTDEHQATQDGRFRHELDKGKFCDMRVSIVPTYHGENCVLRLLAGKTEELNLEDLGFSENDRRKIESAIKKPNGMILSTGPTGSGKTTTLYSLIRLLNVPEVSIVTIEDPIEYAIDNIEQIQVNAKSSLTFANGLRSILRQDPNIIMVGEIRDAETANIAVNTALTGHLLLSTLHTNDAATTLPRLLDMGIEEYLVASTVSIAIGQRLVRKICENCKEETELPENLKESIKEMPYGYMLENRKVFKGKGCDNCGNSGYKGRICVNEVLVADDSIREAILKKASASEIKRIAIERGMTPIVQDGFNKVLDGKTSLEEVLRVIRE